ncbi:hypothetical protein P171DRAFT_274212 [Karstenula rhodostoma CBS 690.94]|uniref:Uncharacterized protein n=1 Tax=Karstenula rhodostoma CBS 690.94 TaxID=1392251 RepID=A0A9P4UD14_9PLEO|nr:hypothetical protein P171DRAFT_274212 [Karstenula rhodostoma CBS 690.94]
MALHANCDGGFCYLWLCARHAVRRPLATFGDLWRYPQATARRRRAKVSENLRRAAFSQPARVVVVSQRCRHMPAADVIRASLLWQQAPRRGRRAIDDCAAAGVRQRPCANRPSAGEPTHDGTHTPVRRLRTAVERQRGPSSCSCRRSESEAPLECLVPVHASRCTANPRCVIESLSHALRAASATRTAANGTRRCRRPGQHPHWPAHDAACLFLFLSRCSAPGVVDHWQVGTCVQRLRLTDPALNRRCWPAWLLGQAILLADHTLSTSSAGPSSPTFCPLSLKAVAGWDVGRFWFHRAVATI